MLKKKLAFLLYTIAYFNAACSSLFYGKLVLKTSALNPKHYMHKPTVFATRRSTYLKKNGDVFRIHIPGIARNATHDSISFESVRWPGYFLRHRIVDNDYKFRIAKPALEDENFDRESTFLIQRHTGIEGSGMLRLFENPQYYLCVRKYNNADSALKAMKNDHSRDFAERCSFFIQKLKPENVDAAVLKSTQNKNPSKFNKNDQKNDKRVRKILEEYVKNFESKHSKIGEFSLNKKDARKLYDLKDVGFKTTPLLTKNLLKIYPELPNERLEDARLLSTPINYIPPQVSSFYSMSNPYSSLMTNYQYSNTNPYYSEIENRNPNMLSYFPVVSRYDPMQTDIQAFFARNNDAKIFRLKKNYDNQIGTAYASWKQEIVPRSVLGGGNEFSNNYIERKTHQVKRNIMKATTLKKKTNKTQDQGSENLVDNYQAPFFLQYPVNDKKETKYFQSERKKNVQKNGNKSIFQDYSDTLKNFNNKNQKEASSKVLNSILSPVLNKSSNHEVSNRNGVEIIPKVNQFVNSTITNGDVFEYKTSVSKEENLVSKTHISRENSDKVEIFPENNDITKKREALRNDFETLLRFTHFDGKEKSETEKTSENDREGHLIGMADALETSAALTVDRLSKDSLMKEVSALGFNGPTYNEVLGNLTTEADSTNEGENNKNHNSDNKQKDLVDGSSFSKNETTVSKIKNVTNLNRDSKNESLSKVVSNATQISKGDLNQPKNDSFNFLPVSTSVKPENNLTFLSNLTKPLVAGLVAGANERKGEPKLENVLKPHFKEAEEFNNSVGEFPKSPITNNQKNFNNATKNELHQTVTEKNSFKAAVLHSNAVKAQKEQSQAVVSPTTKDRNKKKKETKNKNKKAKKNRELKKKRPRTRLHNYITYGTEEFSSGYSSSETGNNDEENETIENANNDETLARDFNWNNYDETKLNEETVQNEHLPTNRESNADIEKMSKGENYENMKLEPNDAAVGMNSHELTHHPEGDGIMYNNIDKAKNMNELGTFEMKGIASAMDKLNKEDVKQLKTKMKNLEIIDTKNQKERLSEGTDYHEELRYVANDDPKVEVNNHVTSSLLSTVSNEAFPDTMSTSDANGVGDMSYHTSDEAQDVIHDTINTLRQSASREPDIVEEATVVPLRESPASFQPSMIKKESDQYEQNSNIETVDNHDDLGDNHDAVDDAGNEKIYDTKGIDVAASRSNLNYNQHQTRQKSSMKLRDVARSTLLQVPISSETQKNYFPTIHTVKQDKETKRVINDIVKRGKINIQKETENEYGDNTEAPTDDDDIVAVAHNNNSIVGPQWPNSTIKIESADKGYILPVSVFINTDEKLPAVHHDVNVVRHTHHILKVKDEAEKEEMVSDLVNFEKDKCVSLKLSNDLGYRYRLISSINSHGYTPRGKFFTLKTVFKDPNAHKFVSFHCIDDTDSTNQILLNGKREIVKVPESCRNAPELVHVSSPSTEIGGIQRKRNTIHKKLEPQMFRKSSIIYPTIIQRENGNQLYIKNGGKDYTKKDTVTRPSGSEIFYGKLVLRTEPLMAKSMLAERHFIFATRSTTYLKKDGDVFKIHNPGLAPNAGVDSISFESVRWPGFFLKHRAEENDFKFRIEKPEPQNMKNFNNEATFIVEKYHGVEGSGLLRLFEKPDWYMCVRKYGFQNSALKAIKNDNSKSFEKRCSFFIEKLEPEMVKDELSKAIERNDAPSVAKRKTVQKPAEEIRRLLDDYISNGRNELVKDLLEQSFAPESKREYVNKFKRARYLPLKNNPIETIEGKQWRGENPDLNTESRRFVEANHQDENELNLNKIDNFFGDSSDSTLIGTSLRNLENGESTQPFQDFGLVQNQAYKEIYPRRLDSYEFRKISPMNIYANSAEGNRFSTKYTRSHKPVRKFSLGMRRDIVPGTKILPENSFQASRSRYDDVLHSERDETSLFNKKKYVNQPETNGRDANHDVDEKHVYQAFHSNNFVESLTPESQQRQKESLDLRYKVPSENKYIQKNNKKRKTRTPKKILVKKVASKKHSIPLVIYDEDVLTVDKPSHKDKVDVIDYDELLKTGPKLRVKHVYADSNGHVEGYSPNSLVRKLTSPSNSLNELKKLGKHVKLGQKCKRTGVAIIDVAECDDNDPYAQIGNETIHLIGGEEEVMENSTTPLEHDEEDREHRTQGEDPIDSITTETADDDKESETEEIYGKHHHYTKNNYDIENEEEEDEDDEPDEEERIQGRLKHHHLHHHHNQSTHEEERDDEEEEEEGGKEVIHQDEEEDHDSVIHHNAEDENNEHGQKMYHDEEHEWVDEKGDTHFYTHDAWLLKLEEDKIKSQNKTNSTNSPNSAASFNVNKTENLTSIVNSTTKSSENTTLFEFRNETIAKNITNDNKKNTTFLNSPTVLNITSSKPSHKNANESNFNKWESSLNNVLEDKKNSNSNNKFLKSHSITNAEAVNKSDSNNWNENKISDVQNQSKASSSDHLIKYVDEKISSNFSEPTTNNTTGIAFESRKLINDDKLNEMSGEKSTDEKIPTDHIELNRTDLLKENSTKTGFRTENKESSKFKAEGPDELKNKKVIDKNSNKNESKAKEEFSQQMHEWKDENGDMHYYTEEAWKMKLADDKRKSPKKTEKKADSKNASSYAESKVNESRSHTDADSSQPENKQILLNLLNSSEPLVKNIILDLILKKPMLKRKSEQLTAQLVEGLVKQPLFDSSSADNQERMLKHLKNITANELSLLYLKKLKSDANTILKPKLSEQVDMKPGEVIQGIVNELTKKQTYPLSEHFSNKIEGQNVLSNLEQGEGIVKWSSKAHVKEELNLVPKSNRTKATTKFHKSINHRQEKPTNHKQEKVTNKHFEVIKKLKNMVQSKKHSLKSTKFESSEKKPFNVVSKFIEQNVGDADLSIFEDHKITEKIDRTANEVSIEKPIETRFEENIIEKDTREVNNTNNNHTLHLYDTDSNEQMIGSGEADEPNNLRTILTEHDTGSGVHSEFTSLKENLTKPYNQSIGQRYQPQEQIQQKIQQPGRLQVQQPEQQQDSHKVKQDFKYLTPGTKPETLKDIHIYKAGKPEPHLEGLKPKEVSKKLEFKQRKVSNKKKQSRFSPTPSSPINPTWPRLDSLGKLDNKSTNENFPHSVKHVLNPENSKNKSNNAKKYASKSFYATSEPVRQHIVNLDEKLNIENGDPAKMTTDRLFKQLEKSTQMLKARLHVNNETKSSNGSAEAMSNQSKDIISEKPKSKIKVESGEETDVLSESAALVKLAGLDDFDGISGFGESETSSNSEMANEDDKLASKDSGKTLLPVKNVTEKDSKQFTASDASTEIKSENGNMRNQDKVFDTLNSKSSQEKFTDKADEKKLTSFDKLARFASDILKVQHFQKEEPLNDEKTSHNEIDKSSLTELLSSVLDTSDKDDKTSPIVTSKHEVEILKNDIRNTRSNDSAQTSDTSRKKSNEQKFKEISPAFQEEKTKHKTLKKETSKQQNFQTNEMLSVDDDDTKDMNSISQALDEVMAKDGENSMKTLDSIDKSAQDILSETDGSGDLKTSKSANQKLSNDVGLQEKDNTKPEKSPSRMKATMSTAGTKERAEASSADKNLQRNSKYKKVNYIKGTAMKDDLIHEFRQLLSLAEQKSPESLPKDLNEKKVINSNAMKQSATGLDEASTANLKHTRLIENSNGNTGDEGDEHEGDSTAVKSLHNKGSLEEMEDSDKDAFHQHKIVTVKDEAEKERMLNGLVTDNDRCVSIQFENELGTRYKLVSSINNHGYTPRGKIFTLKQVFKDPRAHRYVSFHATDESDPSRTVLLNGARELIAVPVSCRYQPRVIHVTSRQPAKLTNLFKKNGVLKKKMRSSNSPFDRENEVAMCPSRCTEYCSSSCPSYCCSAPISGKNQQQFFVRQKTNSNPFDEEMNVLSAGEEISDNAGGIESDDFERPFAEDNNSDSQTDRWWW